MDQRLRRRERGASGGDLDGLLSLAGERRRAGRFLHKPGHGWVGGPLLAEALRAAFRARGQREAALLRAAGTSERQLEKWVRAYRALALGEPRPWPVARRWGELLGIDPEQLAALAEQSARPGR